MTSRVFVVSELRRQFDLSSAENFGSLMLLFSSNEQRPSVFDVSGYAEAVLDKLEQHEFSPSCDYVCVVGSIIPTTIACMAIAAHYEDAQLLLYDSTAGRYVNRCFHIQLKREETHR